MVTLRRSKNRKIQVDILRNSNISKLFRTLGRISEKLKIEKEGDWGKGIIFLFYHPNFY